MLKTFSAQQVTADVLSHLERRRPAIVHDDAAIGAEIKAALLPVRREYAELDLPARYLDALEAELLATVPARWRQCAEPFTLAEARGFGIWRGGDVLARLAYLAAAAAVGFFIVWAPFIPIWEKWLPFALGAGAWWLPDLQIGFHRRRYARQLGEIVMQMDQAQRQLERQVSTEELIGDADRPAGIDRLRASAAHGATSPQVKAARPQRADGAGGEPEA